MTSLLNWLILISLIEAAFGRLCEQGWIYSPHTKYCYFGVGKPTTFNNAEVACLMKKANLVSIHSEAENRLISEMAAKFGRPIWVGGAMFGKSQEYENIDTSPFDYANWQNGTRPVYNKGRKCVKIDPENRKWFNDCCIKRPVAYVCKKSTRKGVPYWHSVVEMPTNATNCTADVPVTLKMSNDKFTYENGTIEVEHRKSKDKEGNMVHEVVVKGFGNKWDRNHKTTESGFKSRNHTATEPGFKSRNKTTTPGFKSRRV